MITGCVAVTIKHMFVDTYGGLDMSYGSIN